MAKRIATAVLMCAVMAMIALVPLVASEGHTIVKGPQGPRASSMTWTYAPMEYGVWTAMLDNQGLRSLVLDVADNTSGFPVEIFHQRIRFAAYNVYPTGIMYSESVPMAAGSVYEITATPNGPRDSYVVVSDQFVPNTPPVAMFSHSEMYLTVNVDASGSYDPDPDGSIASYIWEWGDDNMDSGVVASHTYAMAGTYMVTLTVADNLGATDTDTQAVEVTEPQKYAPVAMFTATPVWMNVSVDASASTDSDGTIVQYAWDWETDGTVDEMSALPTAMHIYSMAGDYLITLVVTDNDGLTGTASQLVTVAPEPDDPPVAMFTFTVNGMTVSVDASLSTDDKGIVSWDWSWGDGTYGTGMTATHTYAPTAKAASQVRLAADSRAPPPPYYCMGYTLDQYGAAVGGSTVTVQNLRTMEYIVTTSDPVYGFYQVDLNLMPSLYLVGDMIGVTAVKGDMSGYAQSPTTAGPYLQINVTLTGAGGSADYWITLTVTDTKGQTASMAQMVTVTW